MTFCNYAFYNVNSGLIENVICIEKLIAPSFSWPEGYSIVEIPLQLSGEWSMCGIGWRYIDGQFVEPTKPQPVPPPDPPVSSV
jgi:hypothetical protein